MERPIRRCDTFGFHSPVRLHYGEGLVDRLGEFAGGAPRVLVVTGRASARASGLLDRVCAALGGREVAVFDRVEPNPSIETVEAGAQVAAEAKTDLVVGVGGGSALDAAKVVAVLAANGGGFREHFGKDSYPHPPIPVLAVPTTCGTGSEMNHYAIITDRQAAGGGDKVNFSSAHTFPQAALLDPTVLNAMPAEVLVGTALDAFTHAFEGYTSRRSQPAADALAEEAMGLILTHLPRAAAGDADSKGCLLYAAALAGIVIAHTGTTMLHAMGYYLTLQHGIPHGMANALLLPALLEHLHTHLPDKVRAVLQLLPGGADKPDMTRYLHDLGIDTALSAHGIAADELGTWAAYVAAKGNTAQTAGHVDEATILGLLRERL